jgi:hypothetical protein
VIENYTVHDEDILNPDSLATINGTPLYIRHPDSPIISIDNYKDFPSVGVCTDKYRRNEDGNGGIDVYVKITDKECYNRLKSRDLRQVSPGYVVKDGVRHYNHVALLPSDTRAKGKNMDIRLESGVTQYIDDGIFVESYAISSTNLSGITTNQGNIIMDELLGAVAADLSAVKDMVSSILAKEVDEPMNESNKSEGVDAAYEAAITESYERGRREGAILSFAQTHGYAGDNPEEARSAVITKAFPNLKIEGQSGAVMDGAYLTAVSHLNGIKPSLTGVSSSSNPVARPNVTDAPGIRVESNGKKTSRYSKMKS